MRLLCILLMVIFCGQARAATQFGPVITYEKFKRSVPENADVERWGGGLRLTSDLIFSTVALDLEGLYSQEHDLFATGNIYSERSFRGRAGLLLRVVSLGPLHFGVRGGGQYNNVSNQYVTAPATLSDRYHHWTQYGGLEIELTPVSGFGLYSGATFSYDKFLKKWLPEYSFGIVFR